MFKLHAGIAPLPPSRMRTFEFFRSNHSGALPIPVMLKRYAVMAFRTYPPLALCLDELPCIPIALGI